MPNSDFEKTILTHCRNIKSKMIMPTVLLHIDSRYPEQNNQKRCTVKRKLFAITAAAALITVLSTAVFAAVAYFNGDLYTDWVYCNPDVEPAVIQAEADEITASGNIPSAADPYEVVKSFLFQQGFYPEYQEGEFELEQKMSKVIYVSSKNGGLFIELYQPETKGDSGIWVIRRYRLVNKDINHDAASVNVFDNWSIDITLSLIIPETWYAEDLRDIKYFKISDLIIGSIEYYKDYKITEDVEPSFLGNHSEWISTTKIETMNGSCYKVDYKRTAPAASADKTALFETAYVFVVEADTTYNFVITFNNIQVTQDVMNQVINSVIIK